MESKADKLKILLQEVEKLMKELNIPDEVLEKKITASGNSAHIVVPRKYLGKGAIVIVRK